MAFNMHLCLFLIMVVVTSAIRAKIPQLPAPMFPQLPAPMWLNIAVEMANKHEDADKICSFMKQLVGKDHPCNNDTFWREVCLRVYKDSADPYVAKVYLEAKAATDCELPPNKDLRDDAEALWQWRKECKDLSKLLAAQPALTHGSSDLHRFMDKFRDVQLYLRTKTSLIDFLQYPWKMKKPPNYYKNGDYSGSGRLLASKYSIEPGSKSWDFRDLPDVALALIKFHYYEFRSLPEALRMSRKFVLSAVRTTWQVLSLLRDWSSDDIAYNREILLAAFVQNLNCLESYRYSRYRDDRAFMKELVQRQPKATRLTQMAWLAESAQMKVPTPSKADRCVCEVSEKQQCLMMNAKCDEGPLRLKDKQFVNCVTFLAQEDAVETVSNLWYTCGDCLTSCITIGKEPAEKENDLPDWVPALFRKQ